MGTLVKGFWISQVETYLTSQVLQEQLHFLVPGGPVGTVQMVSEPWISLLLSDLQALSPRSHEYDRALSVFPGSENGHYLLLHNFSALNHVSPSPLTTAIPPRPQLSAAPDPGQEGQD